MTASFAVYQYLRATDYDIVHFHDYLGIGYYSLVAKHLGIAFVRKAQVENESELAKSFPSVQTTSFVVGAHGSSLWAKVRYCPPGLTKEICIVCKSCNRVLIF